MKQPSRAEPVTEMRRIKIVECGEPLVDFLEHCPLLRLDDPIFNYTRATAVRQSVAEMLCQAAKSLPAGYRLGVIEGWRPRYIQRRMYRTIEKHFSDKNPDWSDSKLRRFVNQYTAPPDGPVPPPHLTGGAVDLRLLDESGNRVECASPYDRNDPVGFPLDAPGLDPIAREHRDILAAALLETALTNYPSEYWHWSYGDQGWAYRGGHPNAIYGAIDLPGWTPSAGDDSEEPFRFLIDD